MISYFLSKEHNLSVRWNQKEEKTTLGAAHDTVVFSNSIYRNLCTSPLGFSQIEENLSFCVHSFSMRIRKHGFLCIRNIYCTTCNYTDLPILVELSRAVWVIISRSVPSCTQSTHNLLRLSFRVFPDTSPYCKERIWDQNFTHSTPSFILPLCFVEWLYTCIELKTFQLFPQRRWS